MDYVSSFKIVSFFGGTLQFVKIIFFIKNNQIFESSSFDPDNVGKTILVQGTTKSEYNGGVSLNGGHIMIDPPKLNCEDLLSWWLTNPSTISIRLILYVIHFHYNNILIYSALGESNIGSDAKLYSFSEVFHFNLVRLVQSTIRQLLQYAASGVFLNCD